MKTVLVTGGAGFIGSNFIRHLRLSYGSDLTILNVDKLTYAGNLESISDIIPSSSYHFFKVGIEDKDAIEPIFQKFNIDTVINFAAESHVDRSIMDGFPFVQTNVIGTQVLLDLSLKYQVKKYVQVSTDEVYGSLGTEGFFTEDSPLKPNSPYAASKAGGDLMVRSYYKTHKLPCVITRCTNNYGPYQFPEKLIPLMISNCLEKKPLPVYGNGQNVRDWIHVLDHCRAVERVAREGKPGEIYNIGSQNEVKNLDLIKQIIQKLGASESLLTFVPDRPGHDFRYALNSDKITSELGWTPQIAFTEGLSQTVEWYLSHKTWWEHIKSGDYQHYYEKQYQR